MEAWYFRVREGVRAGRLKLGVMAVAVAMTVAIAMAIAMAEEMKLEVEVEVEVDKRRPWGEATRPESEGVVLCRSG